VIALVALLAGAYNFFSWWCALSLVVERAYMYKLCTSR
jgi:hypothetical protein